MCTLMEFVFSCPAMDVCSVMYDGGPLLTQEACIMVARGCTPL